MNIIAGIVLGWMLAGSPKPVVPPTPLPQDDGHEYLCSDIDPKIKNYDEVWNSCQQKYLEEVFGITKEEYNKMLARQKACEGVETLDEYFDCVNK